MVNKSYTNSKQSGKSELQTTAAESLYIVRGHRLVIAPIAGTSSKWSCSISARSNRSQLEDVLVTLATPTRQYAAVHVIGPQDSHYTLLMADLSYGRHGSLVAKTTRPLNFSCLSVSAHSWADGPECKGSKHVEHSRPTQMQAENTTMIWNKFMCMLKTTAWTSMKTGHLICIRTFFFSYYKTVKLFCNS